MRPPWKTILKALPVILLPLLPALALYFYYGARLDTQRERNNYLRNILADTDKNMKELQELEEETELVADHISAVQTVRKKAAFFVEMLSEFSAMEEGITLDRLQLDSDRLTLTGSAVDDVLVSNLMQNLADSRLFVNPVLVRLEKTGDGKTVAFEITCGVDQAFREYHETAGA